MNRKYTSSTGRRSLPASTPANRMEFVFSRRETPPGCSSLLCSIHGFWPAEHGSLGGLFTSLPRVSFRSGVSTTGLYIRHVSQLPPGLFAPFFFLCSWSPRIRNTFPGHRATPLGKALRRRPIAVLEALSFFSRTGEPRRYRFLLRVPSLGSGTGAAPAVEFRERGRSLFSKG